ncbi:hypothetical protein ACFL4A_04995, partial [bacterium]
MKARKSDSTVKELSAVAAEEVKEPSAPPVPAPAPTVSIETKDITDDAGETTGMKITITPITAAATAAEAKGDDDDVKEEPVEQNFILSNDDKTKLNSFKNNYALTLQVKIKGKDTAKEFVKNGDKSALDQIIEFLEAQKSDEVATDFKILKDITLSNVDKTLANDIKKQITDQAGKAKAKLNAENKVDLHQADQIKLSDTYTLLAYNDGTMFLQFKIDGEDRYELILNINGRKFVTSGFGTTVEGDETKVNWKGVFEVVSISDMLAKTANQDAINNAVETEKALKSGTEQVKDDDKKDPITLT